MMRRWRACATCLHTSLHGSANLRRLLPDSSTARSYVYHPPGSQEPSLPWYRSPASTAVNRLATAVPPSLAGGRPVAAMKLAAPSPPGPASVPGSDSNDRTGLCNPLQFANLLECGAGEHVAPPAAVAPCSSAEGEPDAGAGGHQSLSTPRTPTSPAGHGALRTTATRRMSALGGPSLDTRIEEIIKVEESVSTELLPQVVQLLIDPNAEGVERITLADFSAMQPKRQLVALGGKKAWLEFLLDSPYYHQVSRLSAAESPAHDLRALQQAGIYTLHQWAERPNMVKVSPRTRSALDASVEYSVTTYMAEVAQVVNTSGQFRELLHRWVSDVVGKFLLDTLKISVEAAMAALLKKRGRATASGAGTRTPAGRSDTSAGELSALGLLWEKDGEEQPGGGAAATRSVSGGATLHPGEACTIEHYYLFFLKVRHSLRQDYAAQHAGLVSPQGRGDEQTEAEIYERTHTVVATALTQLLEHAVQHHLPAELRWLEENGYLALDRVPGLLRQAASYLQLRDVPVRLFVFHSTAEASAKLDAAALLPAVPGAAPGALPAPMDVLAPVFAPGTFLCGSEKINVTLGEWSGKPVPPSSTARQQAQLEDPAQQEYFSVLHRMRRHVEELSATSLYDILSRAEAYGANGFSVAEALGLHQLFGPAKLVEDRLVSWLHYPPAVAEKPIHFIEASYNAGKSALLERLSARTCAGERAVLVRYSGSATPFIPDLDDHPIAFASRFWLRVALACCPHLIRTEELFSRAPRSVMWWGNRKNWSWEAIQRLIGTASRGKTHADGWAATALGNQPQLSAILVDDVDRVLDSMEAKWGILWEKNASYRRELAEASDAPLFARAADANADEDGDGDDEKGNSSTTGRRRSKVVASGHRGDAAMVEARKRAAAAASSLALSEAEQRHQELGLWFLTGKTAAEVTASAFSKITTALGQVDIVFSGHRLSPLLQAKCPVPIQRYYIPVANGVGLQQRLRVLPLMAALHALHLRSRLEMPGVLYEVLKNCPGLAGKALGLFWNDRVALLDLHRGPPRLSARVTAGAAGGAASRGGVPLVNQYAPQDLFAELPLRHYLLRNPRHARLRLVELLQRQLSTPSGYLTTGIDTNVHDEKDGLVSPHNHTASQVHPFALFIIFTYQDALMASSSVSASSGGRSEGGGGDSGGGGGGGGTNAGGAVSPTLYSNEKKIVRAWAEVWAEYRSVVGEMATTPERKRDAMRVLMHGALLLRSASVAGAQLDLNLKVPPYGFPLLATPTRARGSKNTALGGGSATGEQHMAEARAATVDSVKKATAAYKAFFANNAATHHHYPFRPMVGLNGGCDIVLMSGTAMALYDIITTTAELRNVVGRFAEALLGVLHVLERQILSADKVRYVQYVTVVSMDQPKTVVPTFIVPSSSTTGGPMPALTEAAAPIAAPYFLDYHAVFEDGVMDRLRQLQQPLGISKVFRTLYELIEELERTHGVAVHQEVLASHEELESLLSPTLLQLVPDATVLPPYTSSVISVEDLMMEAMMKPHDDDEGVRSGGGELHATTLDADADDGLIDDDTRPGAEVDDIASDRLLSTDSHTSPLIQRDVLLADSEGLHESAELLEALLNDQLDELADTSSQKAATATTAQELQQDLLAENALNYNSVLPTGTGAAQAGARQRGAPDAPQGGRAALSELDSLAWLHDIITPESLLAGLPGKTPSPSPSATNGVSGAGAKERPAPASGNGNGNGNGGDAVAQDSRVEPAAVATAAREENEEEGNWTATLQSGGVDDSANEVFPMTVAKRAERWRPRPPQATAERGGRRGARSTPPLDIEKLLHEVDTYAGKVRRRNGAGDPSPAPRTRRGAAAALKKKPQPPPGKGGGSGGARKSPGPLADTGRYSNKKKPKTKKR